MVKLYDTRFVECHGGITVENCRHLTVVGLYDISAPDNATGRCWSDLEVHGCHSHFTTMSKTRLVWSANCVSSISRVPDQNGVSQAWYIEEIHHSGWKPSICSSFFDTTNRAACVLTTEALITALSQFRFFCVHIILPFHWLCGGACQCACLWNSWIRKICILGSNFYSNMVRYGKVGRPVLPSEGGYSHSLKPDHC